MTRYVDVSNLQPFLTHAALDALYTAGVRGVVVGLQYPLSALYPPGNAVPNIAALKQDGRFEIAGYLENTPLDKVLQHVNPEDLRSMRFIAVAVEEGGGFETQDAIDQQIGWIDALNGPDAWIYSSPYQWQQLGLEGIAYPTRKGWCADYDGDPTTGAPSFGGCRIVAKQYSSSGHIPGIPFEIDLNEMEEDEVITKITDQAQAVSVALDALGSLSAAIGQSDGCFIGTLSGTPAGYRDVVLRVRE